MTQQFKTKKVKITDAPILISNFKDSNLQFKAIIIQIYSILDFIVTNFLPNLIKIFQNH